MLLLMSKNQLTIKLHHTSINLVVRGAVHVLHRPSLPITFVCTRAEPKVRSTVLEDLRKKATTYADHAK